MEVKNIVVTLKIESNPLMKSFIVFFLCCLFFLNAQPNWQALPNAFSNPNGQRFDDIFFLDENTGWAVNGFYAAVYKTTDGGATWTEQLNENNLGSSYYFRNIEFLNQNIGFVGTLNGTFFKTTNGGSDWKEVNNISPNPNAICGLDTVGASTVYGCGAYFEPAYIIKSEDYGDTWMYIDMSAYADALVEILFLDEFTGFACGNNSTGAIILKTTDGGLSWNELYSSNETGEFVWKLQIVNGNNNMIFGSIQPVAPNLGKLIKTSDGGLSWSSLDAPVTGIQTLGFIDENQGWLGGYSEGFFETNDGGATWNTIDVGGNLNRILILNPNLAYAAGTTIYKFTQETLSTQSHKPFEKASSLDIKLLENPVKNNLRFSIDFTSDDNISIGLYNLNGKFIKHLLSEHVPVPNLKTYNFNVSNLSAGVYFIDFHNNANRFSKKFLKN